MTVLEASGITVRRNGRAILDDVSFRLNEGEMVGLIGPNGAGKTTLLRVLIGLLRPDTGATRLHGIPVEKWRRRDMGREIAYLAQGAVCHWPMTVERVVALGRLPHLEPWSALSDGDVETIERALRATDVLHLRWRKATTLSGGEQARVLLARALAQGAALLFADEPVSGLDPGHQIKVMRLLGSHVGKGRNTIAVLHDLTLASRYCTRLLLMSKGVIVADGKPEAVITPETLATVYGIEARIEREDGHLFVVPSGLSGPDTHTEHRKKEVP